MGLEILILAAVAGFLFLKLRDVLGKKTGHENPEAYFGSARDESNAAAQQETVVPFPGAEVPQGIDVTHEDIERVVGLETPAAQALIAAKGAEPHFDARNFVDGAKTAYEMILMSFETGDKGTLKPLLAPDVYESFEAAIDDRKAKGYSVDARFVGLRDTKVESAAYTPDTKSLDVTVRYDAEMIVTVRDATGEIVEGDPQALKRMRDVWTYRRIMGSDDPSWTLIETDG